MAKCLVPAGFRGKKDVIFYIVSKRVGPLKAFPNDPADVAVVQYLLKGCMSKRDGFRPLGNLAVDGVYGPMTHYWSMVHHECYDLDELEGLGSFSPASALSLPPSQKAIINLNIVFRELNPGLPGDLEKDPSFPPILRGKLGSCIQTADYLK